jgi:putative hydrolase of the HAD superfamily
MDPVAPGAVMFDLGGVLVRIRREWPALCAAIGLTPSPRSTEPAMHAVRASALDAYQRGDMSLQACAEQWASTLDATPATGRALLEAIVHEPYPATEALVDELHGLGIVTGCLSNTNAMHWSRMMLEFPVLPKLRHRLASHELLLAKPEAAIYEHAGRVLGLPAARILLFDDLPENCEGARAAGWQACLVDHRGDTAAQMRGHLRACGIPVKGRS